jgi:hypothetical protein
MFVGFQRRQRRKRRDEKRRSKRRRRRKRRRRVSRRDSLRPDDIERSSRFQRRETFLSILSTISAKIYNLQA